MGGGGSLHNHRQEAENHQPPPLVTSTDSLALSPPSRPVDHDTTAERDSSGEPPVDDGHSDKGSSRNQSGQCESTAVHMGHQSADFNTDGDASPPRELQLQPPCTSKLSLFSGMQLVSKGRAQHREQSMVGSDGDEDVSPAHQQPSVQASPTSSSDTAESSQPTSAFSFLNL